MIDPKTGIDPDVYAKAKSPRPLWATMLILALVAFLVAVVAVATQTWPLFGLAFAATLVALIVAGIAALTLVRRA
jgi:hypothetical protein